MTDPQHPTPHVTLYHGNNLHILPTIPDASIDSIVTDPPYELGFMGKQWDSTGIAYNVNLWTECLRVLKPGGHLLAFGGTRTYHRMAVAIEDAGFDIRDSLHWIYGSGFPKSLDVSKAIDKAAGAERQVIGHHDVGPDMRGGNYENAEGRMIADITAPATDAAKEWDGWGTALKPAHEPIVLARKPLIGTVAANVLQHGTGALNIDGCRVSLAHGETPEHLGGGTFGGSFGNGKPAASSDNPLGRWPANIIFDEEAGAELDRQSGVSKSPTKVTSGGRHGSGTWDRQDKGMFDNGRAGYELPCYGDTGGASRFFYCAKPSRTERNAGLDEGNKHPTVKPLALMQWLIRLVTPPDGTVLDPFAGSGTTLAAATLENINSIGIELTDDYLPIITARCQWAETQHNQPDPELTLFDNHD